jgi:hypothetical protein
MEVRFFGLFEAVEEECRCRRGTKQRAVLGRRRFIEEDPPAPTG